MQDLALHIDTGLLLSIGMVISMFILVVVVMLNNLRSKANLYFAALIVVYTIFVISSILADSVVDVELAFILTKIDYLSGISTAVALFYFAYNFMRTDVSFRPIVHLTILSLYIFLIGLLFFSNLVLTGVNIVEGDLFVAAGEFDFLFLLYGLVLFVVAINLLRVRYRTSSEQIKSKLVYVLLGLFLTGVIEGGYLVTQRLGLYLGVEELYKYSISATRYVGYIFILFTSYAMLKHRVFEIRVVIHKLLFWFGVAFVIFSLLYGVLVLETILLEDLLHPYVIILNLVIAFVIALVFSVYEQNLRRFLQRYFARYSFDVQEVTEQVAVSFHDANNIEKTSKILFDTIDENLKPERQGLVVTSGLAGKEGVYTKWIGFSEEEVKRIEHEQSLNMFFEGMGDKRIVQFSDIINFDQNKDLYLLGMLDVEVAIHKEEKDDQLEVYYFVGKKRNNTAYSKEDIELLDNVLKQYRTNLKGVELE